MRSRVLHLVATARMLGKAEMICEIDPEADGSVRAEFDRRLQEARQALEADIAHEAMSAVFAMPHASLGALPPVPADLASLSALAGPGATPAAPSLAARPQPRAPAAAYRDWDKESGRITAAPAVLGVLAVLGLLAYWAYGTTPERSDTFQYYTARERCMSVSDALLDLRNGRTPRLRDTQAALQREEADCAARNMYATRWR